MFIINDGDKIFGPISFDELKKLVSNKKISTQSRICLNDQSLWVNTIEQALNYNPDKEFVLISKLQLTLESPKLLSHIELVKLLQKNEINRSDILLLGDKEVKIEDCPDFHPIYNAFALSLKPEAKITREFKRVAYNPEVIWHDNLSVQKSKLRQIGGGGCFLETLKDAEVGENIKIHIRPKDIDHVILANAQIVAHLKNEGFALKFMNIKDSEQKLILAYTGR